MSKKIPKEVIVEYKNTRIGMSAYSIALLSSLTQDKPSDGGN